MKIDDIRWDFEVPSTAGDQRLREVEEKHSITLPPLLRQVLLAHGGGVPHGDEGEYCFPFRDPLRNDRPEIMSFQLACVEEAKSCELALDELIEDFQRVWLEGRRTDLIPFAIGPGGDFVCLLYGKEEKEPAVTFWLCDWDEPIHVADSFEQFLELLEEDTSELPDFK